MTNKIVTVVGSYNVGLFLKGARLPQAGETVIGDTFHEGGGGKGSNQAIAASFMGADVRFIGKVGTDKYGQDALAMYRELGMSTDGICIDETIHSGISVIIIDRDGHNLISCVPGANFRLTAADIDAQEPLLRQASIVGFQLESPLDVVSYALQKVHDMGVTTLLDPAPAVPLPVELFKHIDIIKPNETEAEILTGIKVDGADTARAAAEWLLDKGVGKVLVTLGSKGVFYTDGTDFKHMKPPVVEAVDSTGAGDVFSGSLMAALAEGKDMDAAIDLANHAAALSVTKLGVIESIPTLSDVVKFMDR